MKLTNLEIASPTWTKLVEHYTPQLASWRARLENPLLPEVERIALCYKIAGVKNLFELAEPPVQKKETAQI